MYDALQLFSSDSTTWQRIQIKWQKLKYNCSSKHKEFDGHWKPLGFRMISHGNCIYSLLSVFSQWIISWFVRDITTMVHRGTIKSSKLFTTNNLCQTALFELSSEWPSVNHSQFTNKMNLQAFKCVCQIQSNGCTKKMHGQFLISSIHVKFGYIFM